MSTTHTMTAWKWINPKRELYLLLVDFCCIILIFLCLLTAFQYIIQFTFSSALNCHWMYELHSQIQAFASLIFQTNFHKKNRKLFLNRNDDIIYNQNSILCDERFQLSKKRYIQISKDDMIIHHVPFFILLSSKMLILRCVSHTSKPIVRNENLMNSEIYN